MDYKEKSYEQLIGIEGLSETLLKNHLELYKGYVKNTNKIIEFLSESEENSTTPQFAELKRRLGWELNGIRLHEYYFENISGKNNKELASDSDFAAKINEDFGSFENWEKDFKSCGLIRGIGWVILYFDINEGKLLNLWINEHDTGHLAGGVPLLIMDLFEHAYMLDYGINKTDYIESFFKLIDWEEVNNRFNEGLKIKQGE